MKVTKMKSLGSLGAGLLLVFAAACDKAGETGAGGEAAEGKTPCGTYADRLCEEVAEETCAAVRTVTKLMAEEACKSGVANFQSSVTKVALLKKKCTELIDKLCADLGPETQTCAMVREQTNKFPPDRCDMMLENYGDVVGELKRREEANKPLTAEKQAQIAADDAPSFGPKNAKVTIVEFSDFECPYCAKAGEVVTKLKKNYGDKVRFVFRQFPLSFHKNANAAAEASLAAHAQGKFWEYHDLLFQNQRQLDEKSLVGYGKKLGLNMKGFNKAMKAKTFADAVARDLKLGELAAVSGTPSMFINGERVLNPMDYEALASMIDRKLGDGS